MQALRLLVVALAFILVARADDASVIGESLADGLPSAQAHLDVFMDPLDPASKAGWSAVGAVRATYRATELHFQLYMYPRPYIVNSFVFCQAVYLHATKNNSAGFMFLEAVFNDQTNLVAATAAFDPQTVIDKIANFSAQKGLMTVAEVQAGLVPSGPAYDKTKAAYNIGASYKLTGTPTYVGNGVIFAPLPTWVTADWRDALGELSHKSLIADEHGDHELVGIGAMVVTCMMVLCILIAYFLKHNKISFFPESVGAMLLGCVVGIAILVYDSITHMDASTAFMFSSTTFFYIILPPIIFEAGYTLKMRRLFFRNFTTICMFAILGTAICAIVTAFFVFAFASAGLVNLDGNSPIECLMFGSLISATDTVATLAIMRSVNAERTLYAIIFGESVLNDGVSIVLFNTFKDYVGKDFTGVTVIYMILQFIGVFLGSVIVGAAVALLSAFMFKRTDLKHYPAYEVTLVFFFAYISYLAAEIMHISGIVALFFCGVIMAQYTYYNLSPSSQEITMEAFHAFGLTTETFLFAYMGITAVIALNPAFEYRWDFPLIFLSLIACVLGRGCNILINANIVNQRRKKPISKRQMLFMWYSGLRGAVAFGLALNVPTAGRPYIITTTICVVMATTCIGGVFTEKVLIKLDLKGPTPVEPSDPHAHGHGAGNPNDSENYVEPTADGKQKFATIDADGNPIPDEEHGRTSPSNMPSVGDSNEPVEEELPHETRRKQMDRESARYGRTSSSAVITSTHWKWMNFDRKYLQPIFGGKEVSGTADVVEEERKESHH